MSFDVDKTDLRDEHDECRFEIERLQQQLAAKDAELERVRSVLKEVRDACKKEPAMQNFKYDDLGAKVNEALASPSGEPESINVKSVCLSDSAANERQTQPARHEWDDQDKCRRCGDRDWYAEPFCTPKQPAEQSACPVCNGEGLNPLIGVPMPCANCHG